MEQVKLRPCFPEAWRRHGIVLAPTESWEGNKVQNFLCCAEPLDNQRWRLWYSACGQGLPFNLAVAEGVPGERMTHIRVATMPGEPDRGLPLSIGNLPDKWQPVQPVHIRLPDGRHRLYFWAHGPGVARYLVAESDDGLCYRVRDPLRPCLYHPNDRAARGLSEVAALGLTPSMKALADRPAGEPPARGDLISNDATNVYCLDDGTFELYSPGLVRVSRDDPRYVEHDNAAGLLRVIDRWVSEDGLNWTGRRRVIERDAQDPIDQQFYYLAVNRTARGCVGMLGHYRVQAQTMDLEWCFSSDGIRWERPLRRAWLPRGQDGEPDCYGIYAGHGLVQHTGRWWLFYTGVNMAHNNKHCFGNPRSVIMLATTSSTWADGSTEK